MGYFFFCTNFFLVRENLARVFGDWRGKKEVEEEKGGKSGKV